MAIKEMTPHRAGTQDATLKPCFKYTDTAGDWVLIPAGVDTITAVIDASSGSSKLQATNDIAGVRDGSVTAVIDWDEGVISSTIVGMEISNVLAVRQVISAGTAILYLSAK
jgi:hypothetical protein